MQQRCTYAYILRSFFRYAETRGWCAPGLAAGIVPPRVYTGEQLPAGPTWDQVQRLCADAEGDSRTQIRDRAILLLFAIYGLRAGELCRLQLDDVDWEAEIIRFTRSKSQLRIQIYPLVGPAGDAILRYLKMARPQCEARQIFLSLKAPIRPLGNSALWQIVRRRLRRLDLAPAHQGPHALRHACATHLLSQGLSMKEIGDHLGHRHPAATSVYAKVDLPGLRQVTDFSLEGLVDYTAGRHAVRQVSSSHRDGFSLNGSAAQCLLPGRRCSETPATAARARAYGNGGGDSGSRRSVVEMSPRHIAPPECRPAPEPGGARNQTQSPFLAFRVTYKKTAILGPLPR